MTSNRTVRPDAELLSDAHQYLLSGALSGSFLLPDDLDFVVRRGEGCRVYGEDGRGYLDYVLGAGPMILGHANAAVVDAMREQCALGTTYFGLNEPAIELAAEVVRAVPSAEVVRFVGSGSEATFACLRLARAHTGRNKILKFEGAYHGHHDCVLFSTFSSPGTYPTGHADSAGIPAELAEHTIVAPFNDLEKTTELIEEHRSSLAAVIVEPIQRATPPDPGFLEGLREAATEAGAVLVFDEVVTGFRLAYGGAQEYYGVVPDLTALGKAVGGGLPLAVVCGRSEIMQHADARNKGPSFAYVSGTLNGNPLSAAAGLATLRELRKPGTYEHLNSLGETARKELRRVVEERNVLAQVAGEGSLFNVTFDDPAIADHHERRAADRKKRTILARELLGRGVYTHLDAKCYLSVAHTEEVLAETLRAFDASLVAAFPGGER